MSVTTDIHAFSVSLFADEEPTPAVQAMCAKLESRLQTHYDSLISAGSSPDSAFAETVAESGPLRRALEQGDDRPDDLPYRYELVQSHYRSALACGAAAALYFSSVIPCLVWKNSVSFIIMFIMVAFATLMLMINSVTRPSRSSYTEPPERTRRRTVTFRIVNSILWFLSAVAYFALSLSFGAWYITWLLFPLTYAVSGIFRSAVELLM